MYAGNVITEELLVAFLDGNANMEETIALANTLSYDAELRRIVRIALLVDADMVDSLNVQPTC